MNTLRITIAFIAPLMTIEAAPQAGSSTDQATVAVCMENGNLLRSSLMPVLAGTDRIFSQIGICIDWYEDHRHCPAAATPIRIALLTDTPINQLPGALAYSQPFEGIHVQVFYDRVRAAAGSVSVASLFSHVLGHEITHMVEGSDRHSDHGLMKARWNSDDYARMEQHPLPFDEADVILITNGLAVRAGRLDAAVSPVSSLSMMPELIRPVLAFRSGYRPAKPATAKEKKALDRTAIRSGAR
jgi:hypothetical protein